MLTVIAAQLPDACQLAPAFPNPFNSSVQVPFRLDQPSHTRLSVYDGLGRRVLGLLSRSMPAGAHTVSWDGRDETGRQVGSGRYQVRMEVRPGVDNLEAVPGQSPSLVFVDGITLIK